MTPGPNLQELITTVRTDAGTDDPLELLATAVRTVSDLEEVADSALSHFVDQCRRSGASWSDISKALGVTKQAAHKRFSPGLDRFTARAARCLEVALDEAQRLGHGYIGTEHVLLALALSDESIAGKVLAETGATHAAIEERLLKITPRGNATGGATFTPRAATCIEKAIAEALQLGHNYIGTEHLLLALFVDSESLAARILAELGATYDDYRARVIQKLSGFTPA